MSTLAPDRLISAHAEPIPGYRLEERIGVGGFGEVWRASAPGGVKKAIKIVHGLIGDKRAIRELRSLNRAKGLNHPYLLNLERIEECNGQLLIVTELADATLADRYQACLAQGLPGIPREELLGYMRDAAEALDYLFEAAALQHLDVKPDNLLMFGGHIKVADFGLLKDLQESAPSIVSSLTPRYASPEMFNGQAGAYSDQYSLAVLYQEMVSGQLPFPGSNIAALASQHLNCAPDLSSLAGLDRFAVGKALSKVPEHRFANCREFVERLSHRSSAVILTSPGSDGKAGPLAPRKSAEKRSPHHQPPAAEVHDGRTIALAAPEIRSLAPLPTKNSQPSFRPTLFVGVGGTGGKVLARLRQLLADRLGEASALPAIACLYIDTDADLLGKVASNAWNEGLRSSEILITPLRQTSDYRASSVCQLNSISNRWIYNVPKQLRTYGLRALGRIALLDYSQRILAQLKSAVLACTSREAIAATVDASGLPFREHDPRVFVVSSIAGGTGGGMLIDLGYAVRQVLAECGYSDDEVCGLLSYSTGGGADRCTFAAANAYAVLEELRYFGQPGCDYPGEHACGLAGFRETGSTFKSTYLFDLGDNLTNEQFAEGTERMAEYLYLNSVTPAVGLFDECRRLERENPSAEPLRLRTAGLYQFDAATREDPSGYAEMLCRLLVRKWKVGLHNAADDEQIQLSDIGRLYEACDPDQAQDTYTPQVVTHKLGECQVNLDAIRGQITQLLREQLQGEPARFLHTVIHDSLDEASTKSTSLRQQCDVAHRRLQAILGTDEIRSVTDSNLISLRDRALPAARLLGEQMGASLSDWILELVNTDFSRVEGSRRIAACVAEHLARLRGHAVARLDGSRERSQALQREMEALAANPAPKRSDRKLLVSLGEQFASAQFEALIDEAVCKTLSKLDSLVTAAADRIRDMWKDLTQLSDVFQLSAADSQTLAQRGSNSRLATLFATSKKDLIQQLDRMMESQYFAQVATLRDILTRGEHLRDELPTRMRLLARKVLMEACRVESDATLQQNIREQPDQRFIELIESCIGKAVPELLSVGGAKRLIVSVPGELDAARFEAAIESISGEQANFSYQRQGDLLFCFEVEQVSWEGLRTRLIRQRHDCEQLAKRLHTRVDLPWTIV